MTRHLNLADALEHRAARTPDRIFLATPATAPMTFAEFNARANRLAHGLAANLGVGSGDCVALMMRNSNDFLLVSYALKKLGAIEVAINTDFRGPGLLHALNLTAAPLLIADSALLAPVIEIGSNLSHVRDVLVADGSATDLGGAPSSWSLGDLGAVSAERDDDPPAGAHGDLSAVLFTSGTTGPSKGCMLSHRYALIQAQTHIDALQLTCEDCLYNPFPLYHLDASYLCVLPAILVGCRAAVSSRFSASHFWAEIREVEATVFDFMGATLTILAKRDPLPDDRDNPVRIAWGVPMPDPAQRREFEERFDLRLVHNYGLTDGGAPCWESITEEEPPGSCGKVGKEWDLRIVDPDGEELPAGTDGEIVIRPLVRGAIMEGYWGMPERTLETFRDLWLHTGDIGRMDRDGHLFFVSRQNDAIRRRGQNISTWEVEQVVNSHPAVLESVALGVPSELSEENVKVVVVVRDGFELTAAALLSHCQGKMAKYMVPEQVEFRSEIPKTATGKPQRYKLSGAA